MTEQLHDATAADVRPSAPRPPVVATVALAVVLAVGAFMALAGAVLSLDHPTPLPGGLPPQNQDAETLLFVVGFAVLVPLALLAAAHLSRRIAAAGDAAGTTVVAGVLAVALAGAVLALKVVELAGHRPGVHALLAVSLAWWALTVALLAAAARGAPARPLAALAGRTAVLWGLVAVLALLVLLSFTAVPSIGPLGVVVGLAAAVLALALPDLRRRRLGAAADAAVVVALLLLVPDLVIFQAGHEATTLAAALETRLDQYHQDLLLAPANQLLHGGTMLVDTASQYGVGSIYFIAGWFHLAPIGYGTFGFLDDLLTAGWFMAGYAVLRLAGVAWALAAAALGVAVVALVFNLEFPVGALPQYGPLRFGLPMGVALAAVAAERFPWRARLAEAAGALTVAIAAVWSFEQLVYTLFVLAVAVAARAALRPPGARLRWSGRQATVAVLAGLAAHVLLAGATLAATGHLPDWGQYAAYLRDFLFGPVGNITYDVPRWSPALPLGVAYAASAAGVWTLVRTRADLGARRPAALVALAGTTAYAIALFSYYVDRSQSHILEHVALPGLLAAALWLDVVRSSVGSSAVLRRGALACGVAVAALLVGAAWPSTEQRFPRTPLALGVPGGTSLRGAMARLWHPPPLDALSPVGARLLERYMPHERRSLVIAEPDRMLEAVMRADRVDALYVGDPWEASFLTGGRLADVHRAIEALRPGRRMLLDPPAAKALRILERNPRIGVEQLGRRLVGGAPGELSVLQPKLLAPSQLWALRWILERFRVRTLHRGPQGFAVMVLQARVRA